MKLDKEKRSKNVIDLRGTTLDPTTGSASKRGKGHRADWEGRMTNDVVRADVVVTKDTPLKKKKKK